MICAPKPFPNVPTPGCHNVFESVRAIYQKEATLNAAYSQHINHCSAYMRQGCVEMFEAFVIFLLFAGSVIDIHNLSSRTSSLDILGTFVINRPNSMDLFAI